MRTARLALAAGLVLVFALALGMTRFRPVDAVLAESSWGAGTPSSSPITAFATVRPWWRKYLPEAVVVTPEGGIRPVVRVARADVREREGRVSLPIRGVGYDALLGAITAVRSLFSSDLIYDFALVVRLQQLLLAVALAVSILVPYWAWPAFRRPLPIAVFAGVFLVSSLARPNESLYLNEGIVDSAIANPLAVLAALALAAVVLAGDVTTKRGVAVVAGAGLVLGFCTLVRGELAVAFLVAIALLATTYPRREWRRLAPVAVAAAVMLVPPAAYGLANRAIFGHFVPFRMQSGQNLLEPIGQFPNPYGIEYSDEWVRDYLAANGMEYVSFEADAFLTRRYVEVLLESPGLLLRNFYLRLTQVPKRMTLGLGFWTLPAALVGAIYWARRDPRFRVVCVPLFLMAGVLLFYGWFNSMFRLLTPAHFLGTVLLCYLAAYGVERATDRVGAIRGSLLRVTARDLSRR